MTETSFKRHYSDVLGHNNEMIASRFFHVISSQIPRFLADRPGGFNFFEFSQTIFSSLFSKFVNKRISFVF